MIKRWYIVVGCLFLLVSMIAVRYFGERQNRASNMIVSCIMAPFLQLQNIVVTPIKRYYQHADMSEMQQTIDALRTERDELQANLIALHATQAFMQETQELIRYKKRYNNEVHQLAHITMRYLSDHEQSLLVDCGSKHGIEKDMVAVYKNALVGKVTEVYPYMSKITLITDPECKVAVFCSQTKATGIAEGRCNQSSFAVTHINHFDHLKKGDYVISSGSGLVFPKGFGLGRICEFTSDGLLYEVTAKPLVDFDVIKYCYVIKKK